MCLPASTCTGLRPGQGTNRNEGLHRLLNGMNMNACCGPELACARLTQAFFHRNETIQATREGRRPLTIHEYAATTMSNSVTEVFGFLPETSATETVASSLTNPMAPFAVAHAVCAGTSCMDTSTATTAAASSGLVSKLQEKAAQHAVCALTYEHMYRQIEALSTTQSVDYSRLLFLELASEACPPWATSTEEDDNNTVNALLQSYGFDREELPLPPLAAVATAAYRQLSDVSTPADVKHSVAHLTAMSGTLDDYDTFRAQLLEALQGYVQTCEFPLLISPEAQAQLSQAVLDQSWSDVYFVDVILRCLAAILHTPMVIFTSFLDFPVVQYVPQHPPLSCLHPMYRPCPSKILACAGCSHPVAFLVLFLQHQCIVPLQQTRYIQQRQCQAPRWQPIHTICFQAPVAFKDWRPLHQLYPVRTRLQLCLCDA